MAYKQVRLGDYFKFEKGLGYKGEFLAEESDVALIGMDSHEEGGGGYKEGSEKPYVGPYKPEHVAEVGDVIFAATEQGFGLLASPLMVPESDKFQTYIYSHHVLKAFPIKEGFLPEYLYNIFRIDRFRSRAAYGDTGTTVRALPAEVLEEQFVPLPDVPTQQAINDLISMIDQQIANNKALSKSLEMLAQAMFKSWFIDFDPVLAKSKGNKPFGMDDATAALFPSTVEKSEIGEIPRGWRVVSLNEVCDIRQGRYLSPNQMDLIPTEAARVPVIGGNGILGFTSKSTFEFPVPLITCRGSKCGLLQWGAYPSWISNNAMAVTFKHNPRDNGFLMQLFKTLNFDDVITGSAQPQITITHLGTLEFVMPPFELLSHFTNTLNSSQELIESVNLSSRTLDDLLSSILPNLIDGKIDIPEELIAS